MGNFTRLIKHPWSPWNQSCLTGYNSVIFERIYKKSVTVGKISKWSLKWDQSGISSSIRSKVTGKTRLIVQKNRTIQWTVHCGGTKCKYFKNFPTNFFVFGQDLLRNIYIVKKIKSPGLNIFKKLYQLQRPCDYSTSKWVSVNKQL